MTITSDTTHLVGGPLIRYGGKGRTARYLVPHFARARLYVEPFFGAGSVFYKIPVGTYEREAVNDLDKSIVTFFRVLRDRTEDLIRVCSLTPYARDEFASALVHSDDELEEARRVWVRSRQGFAGKARTIGDWGRSPGEFSWMPAKTSGKLSALYEYGARLSGISVDNIDGAEHVGKWARADAFVYCDPPYVAATRSVNDDYDHEMTDADHVRLITACRVAVDLGARVAISGYASTLYDGLLGHWRTLEHDVQCSAQAVSSTARRTECLWMSYPESEELGYVGQGDLFGVASSR